MNVPRKGCEIVLKFLQSSVKSHTLLCSTTQEHIPKLFHKKSSGLATKESRVCCCISRNVLRSDQQTDFQCGRTPQPQITPSKIGAWRRLCCCSSTLSPTSRKTVVKPRTNRKGNKKLVLHFAWSKVIRNFLSDQVWPTRICHKHYVLGTHHLISIYFTFTPQRIPVTGKLSYWIRKFWDLILPLY
jgi:hypothetical protein